MWTFLWDIPRVASCIPGCSEARTLDQPGTYAAVVGERVGPFQVRFSLQISLVEIEERKRIKAVVRGKDSRVASQMRAEVEVALEPADAGVTVMRIVTDVAVLGKLGALGHGIIARKGNEIMQQFARAIQAELGSGAHA